jgi:hypothetical protein
LLVATEKKASGDLEYRQKLNDNEVLLLLLLLPPQIEMKTAIGLCALSD